MSEKHKNRERLEKTFVENTATIQDYQVVLFRMKRNHKYSEDGWTRWHRSDEITRLSRDNEVILSVLGESVKVFEVSAIISAKNEEEAWNDFVKNSPKQKDFSIRQVDEL